MSTTTITTSGSGSTSAGSGSATAGSGSASKASSGSSGSTSKTSTLASVSWWQTILIDVGVLVVGVIMLAAAFFIKADV